MWSFSDRELEHHEVLGKIRRFDHLDELSLDETEQAHKNAAFLANIPALQYTRRRGKDKGEIA